MYLHIHSSTLKAASLRSSQTAEELLPVDVCMYERACIHAIHTYIHVERLKAASLFSFAKVLPPYACMYACMYVPTYTYTQQA